MDAGNLRQIIERAKRDLTGRYDLIHAAMRGEFMSAIYSADVPSTKTQRILDRRLSEIGNEAAKTERSASRSVAKRIHEEIDPTQTSKMVMDMLIFQGDIARQISRDARAVSSLFRQVQTALNQLPKDKHLSAKAQALQHVTKQSVFSYKDKAGKIWNTRIYLKANSSKYYYGLANNLVVGNLSHQGIETATLDRPGHPSDGLEINLNELGVEMRSKYFHPGSQGIMT